VGTPLENINSLDDVSVVVPAGACPSDTVITIANIQNPSQRGGSCLGAYDFGPDGMQFNKPVTITIPYETTGSDCQPAAYWQNLLTDPLSREGITDVQEVRVSSTLHALSFKIRHFTFFFLFMNDPFSPITNHSPVLDLLEDQQVNENSGITLTVSAVDPDSDPITYTAQNLPVGASFQGQAFAWTPTHEQSGSYEVTFIASDGQDQDTQTMTVTVGNVNRPPVLDLLEDQQVNENSGLTLTVSAVDPDNDPIIYTAQNLPVGASFQGQALAWTPTHEQAGSYEMTFTASDGKDQDTQTVTVTVGNVNRPPVLDLLEDQTIIEGTSLTFSVTAQDADGDRIAYSATGLPDGASLASQTFSWVPRCSQQGTHQIVFKASDGQLEDSLTVSIIVKSADIDPPYVAQSLPEPYAIQVARNTLINISIADDGGGIDAASVAIRANKHLIYIGDTEHYQGAYGDCHRQGTKARYNYQFQPDAMFDFDQQVIVTVSASDIAQNSMEAYTFSFVTEMRSFGQNILLNKSPSDQGGPATATDSQGSIWVTWHEGKAGARNIMVARMNSQSNELDHPVQLTHGRGDQCYPDIGIDTKDRVYVVWQDNSQGNWDICSATSIDGMVWSDAKRIVDVNNNQTSPALAIGLQNPGRAYIAYQQEQNDNQDICFMALGANSGASTAIMVTNNPLDQVDPDIAVDSNNNIYIVWTDYRNDDGDLYGASSAYSWTNYALVNTTANQWSPAIAIEPDSAVIHLVWVDDASGNTDILYTYFNGMPAAPLAGINIIDDTIAADQLEPALVVSTSETGVEVFTCWSDTRPAASSLDSDLYFAELSQGSASTNVLVGDDNSNTPQTKSTVGIDDLGQPYIVWTDGRHNRPSIYYAGNTYIGQPFQSAFIKAEQGGTVGTPPERVDSMDDVSVTVPAGACSSSQIVTISVIQNKPTFTAPCLGAYDFGPSGTQFNEPVTITIPYETRQSGSQVQPYWFNRLSSALSEQGITDVQDVRISSTLHVLTFKTTHFTQFYLLNEAEEGGEVYSGSGGGGCSVSPYGQCSIIEYFIPYVGLVLVLAKLRKRDK